MSLKPLVHFVSMLSLLALLPLTAASEFAPIAGKSAQRHTPNIVIIYGDDIGYGDIGCYGAKTIPTPNIDALAENGIRFTSGYCSSATCTPSRYSLLTGEYAWRRPGTGIAPPNGSALIQPGRVTLPSLLRDAGYRTGIVGKWHLGLGKPPKPDWSGTIKPGPLEIGFDYAYLMPTTNDRVPCVYVENHHIVGLDPNDPVDVFRKNPDQQPTGITDRDSLRMDWSHGHNQSIINGISRIGFMIGGQAIRWIDEEMSDIFTKRAVAFIDRNADRPFFLFFSSQAIHVPRAPHPRFVGATPHGPRGDAVVEFDAAVGSLIDHLRQQQLLENTIVIITSDNGPVIDDGYKDQSVELLGNHRPSGHFRGGKYSNFEGGTRVPTILSWPGHIEPRVSNALVSQVDFAASLASIAGTDIQSLPDEAIPDSLPLAATLLGHDATGRDLVVEHAGSLSIRSDNWKYIAPSRGRKVNQNTNTELGNDESPQLYQLDSDPGETNNLAAQYPDKVAHFKALLAKIRSHYERSGAATP